MKKCFTCKKNLPLFMYQKIPEEDYQLKIDKGTLTECRMCSYTRLKRDGSKLHPYAKNLKVGRVRRFTSFDMTNKQAFIYCFLMSYEGRRSYLRYRLHELGLDPYNY